MRLPQLILSERRPTRSLRHLWMTTMIFEMKQDELPFCTARLSYFVHCKAQQMGLNAQLSLNQISLGRLKASKRRPVVGVFTFMPERSVALFLGFPR